MTETKDEPWTVLRLLNWTTDFFKKHGSDSARLDAEILLAHARQCSRVDLYTAFAEVPSDEQRIAFREMIRRRGQGTPVAYLVGFKEFYSLRFRVDERVLIPRPETEELVTAALDFAKARSNGSTGKLKIADVGTGSGAVAITLAKHLADSLVTAIDLSTEALEIARWNAEKLGCAGNIDFARGDLLGDLPDDLKFDLICSNPPYVSENEFHQLDPSVRDFEPKLALVGGADGTDVISRLLDEAAKHLSDEGQLMIELSPMIADACLAMAQAASQLTAAHLVKDLAGQNRFLHATKS